MEKSINIVISETKEKLMQVIVQSKLPSGIVEMVVREVAENVSLQSKQILQQEKTQYQKFLQEQSKKVGENNGSKERTGK